MMTIGRENRSGHRSSKRGKKDDGKKWCVYCPTPVYCIELDEIFWGSKDVEDKYKIAHQSIPKCCTEKRKSAEKHPITNEPLYWLYINDQYQNDDIVVYGAITLGYVTTEQFNEYLNNLRQKGND